MPIPSAKLSLPEPAIVVTTPPGVINRIREPVSRSLEMTSVVFELDRLGKSPVVIFENVEGSGTPVVTNIAGNRKLLAHCLNAEARNLPTAFRDRCQNYIPQIDLTQLPIPFQFCRGRL